MSAAHAQITIPFGERIEVEVVNVDVVVTSPDGSAVGDLAPDDLSLKVNGKEIAITNFSAFFRDVERPSEEAPRSTAAAVETTRAQPPPMTWVVYVDLHRAARHQRWLALRQIEPFLAQSTRPGDRVMVACFDGDALRVLSPPGTVLASATAALRKLQVRAPAREFRLLDIESPSPEFQEDQVARLRRALDSLSNALRILQGFEGRVALLFVSGGYKFSDIMDLTRRAELLTRYQKVRHLMSSGRVTAYTIFAGPERFAGGFGPETGLPGGGESFDIATENFDSYAVGVEPATEVLAFADATGGIPMVAASDLHARLEKVRRDVDGYYSIGFRPPPSSTGKRLDIEVQVRRPGLRVRHREAVQLQTPAEAAADDTMRALLAGAENPWGVRASLSNLRKASRSTHRATITVTIPIDSVVLVERNGRYEGHLQLHFATLDPGGNFRQAGTRAIPLSFGLHELQVRKRDGVRYTFDVIASSGTTLLTMTVADVLGASHSTVRTEIKAPR